MRDSACSSKDQQDYEEYEIKWAKWMKRKERRLKKRWGVEVGINPQNTRERN